MSWIVQRDLNGPFDVHTPCFDLISEKKCAPNGYTGEFVAISAPHWVSAVVYNTDTKKYMMVREYRHGINNYVCEFPSGTVEDTDESLDDAIIRELKEELGVTNVVVKADLFSGNPNVALFRNVHTFFYCEVSGKGEQKLDASEDITPLQLTFEEVNEMFKGDCDELSIAQQFAWERFTRIIRDLQ